MFWTGVPRSGRGGESRNRVEQLKGDRVIGAEIEILTSWDLAVKVAEGDRTKRLLPPTTDLLTKVAHAIGLKPSSAAATESAAASRHYLGLKGDLYQRKQHHLYLVQESRSANGDAGLAGTVKSLFRQAS